MIPEIDRRQDRKRPINNRFDREPVIIPHDMKPDRHEVQQQTRRCKPKQRDRADEAGKNDQPGEVPGVMRRNEDCEGGGQYGGGWVGRMGIIAGKPNYDGEGQQDRRRGNQIRIPGQRCERRQAAHQAQQIKTGAAGIKPFLAGIARQKAEYPPPDPDKRQITDDDGRPEHQRRRPSPASKEGRQQNRGIEFCQGCTGQEQPR